MPLLKLVSSKPKWQLREWAIRLTPVLVCVFFIGGICSLALSAASAQTNGDPPINGAPAVSSGTIGEAAALLAIGRDVGALSLILVVWWYERQRSREILQVLLDHVKKNRH